MNELQSQKGKDLLDAIDHLRKQGIDDVISLPQIIVVGQQSSGKSSVLEAISGVHFPVREGTCTKFATEVILRKSPAKRGLVTMVPKDGASDKRKAETLAFRKDIVDLQQIEDTIEEAEKLLDISGRRGFTTDVLRLEVSGPSQPHLTLVDLPGLVGNSMSGDKTVVKELVTKYMRNPQAIILAIISARDDPENAEILELVKDIPDATDRTLGIITGPDKMDRGGGLELRFRDLIENRARPVKLGWHVLRNPNSNERQDKTFCRDEEEARFLGNVFPWNELDEAKRGIAHLRLRLSTILLQRISQELPTVLKSIEKEIERCEEELTKLGPSRPSSDEKRVFLTEIGTQYQALVKAALDGDYSDHKFFENETLRLRAHVQTENDKFFAHMITHGQSWKITTDTEDDSKNPPSRSIGSRSLSGTSETGPPVHISRQKYIEKVFEYLKENRGKELPGYHSSRLPGDVFKDQCMKWKALSKEHMLAMVRIVTTALESAVRAITTTETAETLLKEKIDAAMMKRRLALDEKITELLRPFQEGHPIDFRPSDARIELCDRRIRSLIEQKLLSPTTEQEHAGLRASDMLIDVSESYYGNALQIFVHNVAMLAIELCLLDGLDELISPKVVVQMSGMELTNLAKESPVNVMLRERTIAKLEALQAGREFCRRHAVRKMLSDETACRMESFNSDPNTFGTPTSSTSRSTASSIAESPPRTPLQKAITPSESHVFDSNSNDSLPGSPEKIRYRIPRSPCQQGKLAVSPSGLKFLDGTSPAKHSQ